MSGPHPGPRCTPHLLRGSIRLSRTPTQCNSHAAPTPRRPDPGLGDPTQDWAARPRIGRPDPGFGRPDPGLGGPTQDWEARPRIGRPDPGLGAYSWVGAREFGHGLGVGWPLGRLGEDSSGVVFGPRLLNG